MSAVGTDHRNIIRNRPYGFIILVLEHKLIILPAGVHMSPEMHLDLFVLAAYFPHVVILQPVIRQLHLIAVYNLLLEQSVFITDAAAVSCILQGSE